MQSLSAIRAATALNDGFFLPRLHQLHLMSDVLLEDISPFGVFLSPATSVVTVTGRIARNFTNLSLVASLVHRCPQLAEASFSERLTLPFRFLQGPFQDMVHLRMLDLRVDSPEGMAALSHLPNLRILTVSLPALAHAPSGTASGGFPSLSKLMCNFEGDFVLCPWVIKLLNKSTPLVSLILTSLIPSPLHTISGLIKLLTNHVNCKTLVNLNITDLLELVDGQDPLPVARPDSTLGPLDDPLHFKLLGDYHSLRSLRIEVTAPVPIGIQSLRPLGHLDLGTLVVGFFDEIVYDQNTPEIKLQELVQILGMFPSLTRLGLPLDATAVPPFSRRPGKGLVHKGDLVLMVGPSPVSQIQDAASLLSDNTPGLKIIESSKSIVREDGTRPVENPHFEKWREVQKMVPILSSIREQERLTALFGFLEPDEEETHST
jgi:hypothetical protein